MHRSFPSPEFSVPLLWPVVFLSPFPFRLKVTEVVFSSQVAVLHQQFLKKDPRISQEVAKKSSRPHAIAKATISSRQKREMVVPSFVVFPIHLQVLFTLFCVLF